MNVAVIGTGYVGLVVGAGLAETGHHVHCVDIDDAKIEGLRNGVLPIYEPGLDPLVDRNAAAGRLHFTTDLPEAVRDADVAFIAVGTPPDEDGSADLRHVLDVARGIGAAMTGELVVVTKSTVPVGTARKVAAAIEAETGHPAHVCSNPEFLKEGAAVDDFLKPDRVVIGAETDHARDVLTELYEPFVRTGNPIQFMDVASAEITKYAANAMLATRISFMNMIADLCEAVGADVDAVRKGVGSDPRIGPSFLFPGIGYGGSCFPKDVQALARTLQEEAVDASILESVEAMNRAHKRLLADRVLDRFGDDLSGRRFAAWGLAFKPGTDDMREAPSRTVIEALTAAGAEIVAHDPVALDAARAVLPAGVRFAEDQYEALEGADALLIHTEWAPYRRPDWDAVLERLEAPIIFDGRNLYDPARMTERGVEYHCIGRPRSEAR